MKHAFKGEDDSKVEVDVAKMLKDRVEGLHPEWGVAQASTYQRVDGKAANGLVMYKMLLYIHDNIREMADHPDLDADYIEQDLWDVIDCHFTDFIDNHRDAMKSFAKEKGDES